MPDDAQPEFHLNSQVAERGNHKTHLGSCLIKIAHYRDKSQGCGLLAPEASCQLKSLQQHSGKLYRIRNGIDHLWRDRSNDASRNEQRPVLSPALCPW
jgi:hypothetical protein